MATKVSVFGLGYVGSVTAACLAAQGHSVIGVDLNPTKVEQLNAGQTPVVEPGMAELVADSHRASRLRATSDGEQAVLETDISLLCVGTPSLRNGKLDLGHLEPVCRNIGETLRNKKSFHLIVVRSTALPGTVESLVIPTLEKFSGKKFGDDFGTCVNPEFMREGTAVKDFMQPSITVIGAANSGHAAQLRELYAWAPGQMFETSFRSAEMLKYVCNAWHALKVAFANEVGSVAKEVGVDAASLMEIFCADKKLNISESYLKPGFAFGGSCLPKDIHALSYRANELDLTLPILDAILPSNDQHFLRALELVLRTGKRKIALLGLSFKANTDDLRESPQVKLVKQLLGEGCEVAIWDESVSLGRLIGSNRDYIERVIPHIGLLLRHDLAETVRGAEVVVIGSRAVGDDELRAHLRPDHFVIDLVNVEKSRRPVHTDKYEGICW
jgi:GDP-mannose 6-dehydrogenase